MKIRTLIVDDEPLAQNVIKQYLQDLPSYELINTCTDAVEAITVLSSQKIDLMFLDINMPKLSGLDFLRTVKNPPLVIITTAYAEYALEGFELNVLDYLKKPFSFERFLKALQKAEEQLNLIRLKGHPGENNETIFIKANKKVHQINLSDILYIEGLGDYIKIHCKENHLVTNLSMKKMEDMLPSEEFFRIHKSYIIQLDKIATIEGNLVQIGNQKFPIGKNYRQDFFDRVNKNFIN